MAVGSGSTSVWARATATTGRRVATAVALAVGVFALVFGATAGAMAVAGHGDRFGVRAERVLPPGPQDRQGWQGPRDGDDDGSGADGRGLGPMGPGGMGPGGMGRGMGRGNGQERGGWLEQGLGAGVLGRALHGDVVVGPTPTAYVFQRGEVTRSSASSLTLRSTDGFTGTYALGADTRTLGQVPAVGAQALVVAKKDGAAAVLVRAVG